MACPALIAKSVVIVIVPVKIKVHKPRAIPRIFAVFLQIFKSEKISADVVKYTV